MKSIKFLLIYNLILSIWKGLGLVLLLLSSTLSYAQVELGVDTTHIRIGEQIHYELSTENVPNVIFPKLEMDSLGKVEVVHSLPIDTLKNRLYKKYLLTSFDSGTYTIPSQEVIINRHRFLTDSLLINVGTVAIDTSKQKLFPIKSIFKATPKTWHDYISYLWWILGVFSLIGLIWWFAFRRRKTLKKKGKILLSPIDEALENFSSLDKKQLIEQKKIKEYYIELTDIIRNYIGKDVNIPTLEVTTDELITLLSIHNKSNKIGIDKERITQLHQFLKQADLVKFAKAKPELVQIQEDRKTAEVIINDIQSVIHKPILDEFGNEIIVETQEQIQLKTSRKQKVVGIIIGVALSLVVVISAISYYGFNYVKDTIIGHPTKELLEGNWYQSSYGYPTIGMETPKVLRAVQIKIPPQAQQMIASNASFIYGSYVSGFYIMVNTFEYNPQINLNIDEGIQGMIQSVQSIKGISNFKYDEEDIKINNVSGKKVTGTMMMNNQKMVFTIYGFITNQTAQQIILARNIDDTYAEKIIERIEKSIQLQKVAETKKE
jgi:hypothetical protein